MHIFISMEKLKKHLCIRLTGEQFRILADVLVDEQLSKSVLVRNLIQDYLESHNNKTEILNKEKNEEYQ
jgi:hypothetical protein